MSLYWQIIKNTWDESTTYRTSFILYRLREVFQLIALYFIWFYVTTNTGTFNGYSKQMMLTYVLVSSLVSDFVFATRTTNIANDINQGLLSQFLLKPISYFRYYFAKDIADKAMNIVFSIAELSFFFLIFAPPFMLQTSPVYLILFAISVGLGLVLHFFISSLLGLVGFWSNETWGPRFIFYQLIAFFAGNSFPLDILPKPIYTFISYLPFAYLNFFPVKVYLGDMDYLQILKGYLITIVWIFVFYKVLTVVWNKGIKSYSAQGQ